MGGCALDQGALPLGCPPCPLTGHELCEGFWTGGWDGQCELVNSHTIGHGKTVDTTVRHFPSQQFPQQHPKAVGKTRVCVPSSVHLLLRHPKAMRN